jgi:nucleoside-diphosphate-sugar epimerase
MRILITGNMGYLGPVVMRQLRASHSKVEIIGFDTGYFAHCLTNPALLPECRVDVQYFADVREIAPEVVAGTDAIVHLAAISNDPMGHRYEQPTLDINYHASIQLAALAKSLGVGRFIYASSCSVYGFAEEGARIEDSPLNPLTAYAKSKVFTERDLEPLASRAFQVTCLRFATACGMSERLRLDLVLNDFVASAVACGKVAVLSDGTPWRPLIHVNDMARAIDWAIQRDSGADFLVLNTGSEQWNYQIRELAYAVAEVFPEVEVSINKDAPPDRRSYKVDFNRFCQLAPDHQPRVSLSEAIRQLRYGLQGMGFRDKDFRSSSLIRLRELSRLCESGLLTDDLRWAPAAKHSAGPQDAVVSSKTAVI